MKKLFLKLWFAPILALCAVCAYGQTSAAPASPFEGTPFAFQANAVSLPGGSQTLAAALTGMTFQLTQNFEQAHGIRPSGDGSDHTLVALPGVPCVAAALIFGYADIR